MKLAMFVVGVLGVVGCSSDDDAARPLLYCGAEERCGPSTECVCGACITKCKTADDCNAHGDPVVRCAPFLDTELVRQCGSESKPTDELKICTDAPAKQTSDGG